MNKTRIYLDNCTYNRPFDDKTQLTIRMEAEAKLQIQEDIRNGIYELVWSYMNEFENNDNPYIEKRDTIGKWEKLASYICLPDQEILDCGIQLQNIFKPKDSLNLACAMKSGCRFFITTDKELLKKSKLFNDIDIINPIDFIRDAEEKNGNTD